MNLMDIIGLTPYIDVASPLVSLGVAPGQAEDHINSVDIVLTASLVKRIDAIWSVGSNAGGLDALTARRVNGTLFIFVIGNPTTLVIDILLSASAINPVMPSGFVWSRRVAAVLLDASQNLLPALWRSDGSVDLMTPIRIGNTLPVDPVIFPLPSPVGAKMRPKLLAVLFPDTVGYWLLARDPDLVPPPTYAADPPTFLNESVAYSPANVITSAMIDSVWTDSNASIMWGVGPLISGITVTMILQGWLDPRDDA